MFCRTFTLLWVASTIWCGVALAQDPGDRTFTSLGGGSIGQTAFVGATGNLRISLPLALPLPRGNVPLPFSVSYNGSSTVGAGGTGWDIPILGVTQQRNLSRRKPVHRFTSEAEPVTADRVFLNVGSGATLMAPTDTPGVYQPFGNGYYELKFDAGAFTGRDAEGRRWLFQKLPALFDDDFFALVRIEDASGINRIDLQYDVFDKFSPDPITTPRADQISARELVLRELSYSHDGGGLCPKYRIRLKYSVSPTVLGFEFVTGRPRTRSRLLQAIELLSSGDTTCQETSVRPETTYRIEYTPDALTGQPRLTNVEMLGPPKGVEPALPVVTYRYGTPVVLGPQLKYTQAESILLPNEPNGPLGGQVGFDATLGPSATGGLYGHVRGFKDMNGDGRADFVSLSVTGDKPVLGINRPSALGNDFSTLEELITLPNKPAAPYNLGAPDLAFRLPIVASIDNTYQQVIDFNGDGRPDIVVATEGRNSHGKRDPNFWKILVNQPGPSGKPSDIVWLERNIDVSALRAAVMQHHVLSPTASSKKNKPLPVERTHQAGAFKHNTMVESSVITQWRLLDVNGDGFPDFVFDSNGIEARIEQICDSAGNCEEGLRQDHTDGNQLMVIYHTGPMMAGSGADTQNVWRGPAVILREDGACGVSRLTYMGGGIRQMQCGFLDANGDGLVDYVISGKRAESGHRVILSAGLAQAHDVLLPENQIPADYAQHELKRTIWLPGPVGMVRDPRVSECAGHPGKHQYYIEQISDLRDITGDGIADYVFFGGSDPQWMFMAGTGTGFINARPIQSPGDVPFALHESVERCDGKFSNVIASLIDLDGDGRPEIVRARRTHPKQSVVVAKLTNADGELGAHSAGQITAIDNRFGSVTGIRYGSAKSDFLGRQKLPNSQIVVTEMEQTAAFHIGTSMAPVRFAYGEPQQVYHPLLGRFVFLGYQRRVEIQGETTPTFNVLKGTAIVTSAFRASDTNILEKLMLAGRPHDVHVLAGSVNADPRQLLGSIGGVPTVASSQTFWRTKPLPGPVPPLVPLEEECYATPSPKTPGVFPDLVLCRRAATAFAAQRTTSEGPQSFPLPNDVATRTAVTEVDDFARPLRVHREGDRRRIDDDICVQTEYATPVQGAALVLDVPKTVRAHECGNTARVLSGVRFQYDDLPDGQVGIGRASSRVLERYNTATAQLIENVPSATLRRDVFGNPIEVTRQRPDGATATTTVTYDPFGLMPVRAKVTATGLATPLVTETVRDPHSLLPLTVTTTTGAKVHNLFDEYSRLKRISLTMPGDPERYVLGDVALTGFDGAPTGRSIRQRVFHKFVPENLVNNPPVDSFTTYTTVFDEFARQLHGIAELGPDYNNQSIIIDSVTYDTLGRPKFVADPFPANVFGPRYGTTFTYLADGRPECMIDGTGEQTEPTTDESVDRYPTCVSYEYRDGQLVVQTRGPNELANGMPQSGAFDQQVISGLGQTLSRSRVKGTTTLELVEYGYDRLGYPTLLQRFSEPSAGPASPRALWAWTNDSLGNVIESYEPAGIKRRLEYDTLGRISAVRWTDSTGTIAVERGIHFAYDGLARLVRTFESINDVQQTDTLKQYFYDVSSGQPQHLDTEFLAGRLSFAREDGRSMFFGYDALGRLTTTSYSEGGEAFAQRSVLGASGQIEALELLNLGTSAPPQHIRYAYDSALRLQAVHFEDTAGVTEMWRALETDIFGRVLRSRLGNGATERFSYRDEGRRELQWKREDAQGKSRLVQFHGFDGAMLPKGISEESTITAIPPTTTRYEYDARNALAHAIVQTPTATVSDLSYSYDGMGNLTEVSDAIGSGSLEIRRDNVDPDRICSVVQPGAPVAPCTYRYDALGNVRSIIGTPSLLFDYNGAGRMRSAQAGTHEASMRYDPFGALTSLRVKDGQIERRESFFGAVSRVSFFNSSGDPLQSYADISILSPLGAVAAIRRSNTGSQAILYPIGEAQGTRIVLGDDGSATQGIAYDSYGNVVSDTGNPASLTFWPYQWNGGHVLDGLGLVMLGQRVLDSRTGRFLQRDPRMNSADATTANPYAFAWNNPATYVDLTGAQPEQRGDTLGAASVAGALGRILQSRSFEPGETVDPYINMSFACNVDHDCMKAVEGVYGTLTGFEQKLQESIYEKRQPISLPWDSFKEYYVVQDRLSQALLGYAFFENARIDILDRSGRRLGIIWKDEPPLQTPLDPIDFIPAGRIVGGAKKLFGIGRGVRATEHALEGKVAREMVEGGVSGTPRLPPFQTAPPGGSLIPAGARGTTSWWGDIYISSKLAPGSADFIHTLRHEAVHRFLSPRWGGLLGLGKSRGLMKAWFYHNSHLLRYTEEALAESIASGSLRWGLRYPFLANYSIKASRLVLEGVGVGGAYGGLLYGGYQIGQGLERH